MYEPEVNDYVIWKRPSGDTDEGWVYHKGESVDNEKRKKQGKERWFRSDPVMVPDGTAVAL